MPRNRELTAVQEKLLQLLTKNIEDPLTVRELQARLGFSSTSVVVHHLRRLEKKGYLKRNPNDPRDYQVLGKTPEKPIVYLNLFGLVYCGPDGSILDGNPIEKIPVPTRLLSFPSSEAFMVKAKGDSMEPRIHDGDLVIVRKTHTAETGSIVVCVNDEEALVKKIHKENKKIILTSLNPAYPPFLAAEDFRVEGEVKQIISSAVE